MIQRTAGMPVSKLFISNAPFPNIHNNAENAGPHNIGFLHNPPLVVLKLYKLFDNRSMIFHARQRFAAASTLPAGN